MLIFSLGLPNAYHQACRLLIRRPSHTIKGVVPRDNSLDTQYITVFENTVHCNKFKSLIYLEQSQVNYYNNLTITRSYN